MLMLKDNHIDRAGGIPQAMAALRKAYRESMETMPPVEIECRTLAEVGQAVAEAPRRIMLDNMDQETMRQALALVPAGIETEVSGGVDIAALAGIGALGPDFVSVGRVTIRPEAPTSACCSRRRRPMNASLADNIAEIRRQRGADLAILAHHYQRDEVVAHADILGDSLELSRKIAGCPPATSCSAASFSWPRPRPCWPSPDSASTSRCGKRPASCPRWPRPPWSRRCSAGSGPPGAMCCR